MPIPIKNFVSTENNNFARKRLWKTTHLKGILDESSPQKLQALKLENRNYCYCIFSVKIVILIRTRAAPSLQRTNPRSGIQMRDLSIKIVRPCLIVIYEVVDSSQMASGNIQIDL